MIKVQQDNRFSKAQISHELTRNPNPEQVGSELPISGQSKLFLSQAVPETKPQALGNLSTGTEVCRENSVKHQGCGFHAQPILANTPT
jgi:hypothetical protein